MDYVRTWVPIIFELRASPALSPFLGDLEELEVALPKVDVDALQARYALSWVAWCLQLRSTLTSSSPYTPASAYLQFVLKKKLRSAKKRRSECLRRVSATLFIPCSSRCQATMVLLPTLQKSHRCSGSQCCRASLASSPRAPCPPKRAPGAPRCCASFQRMFALLSRVTLARNDALIQLH